MIAQRVGYALGAVVTGIDLRREIDDATMAQIRKLWLEHAVLCFSDQDLDAEQLVGFSRRFGDVDRHESIPDGTVANYPEIKQVTNKVIDGRQRGLYTGRYWHSDMDFTPYPSSASLLLAKEIPDVGGDTLFTNTAMAYDALSPKLQSLLEGLDGVRDSQQTVNLSDSRFVNVEEIKRRNPPMAHPLVRTHPETGKKTLFVGDRLTHIVGMTKEESRPLIDFLNAHVKRPEFLYWHRWTLNDLLVWDNRCTMHYAIGNYDHAQIRYMMHTDVRWERAGYVYSEELVGSR